MLVGAIYESLVDLGKDEDDLVLLNVGDTLVRRQSMIKLQRTVS